MYINKIIILCILLVQFNLRAQESQTALSIQEISFKNTELLKHVMHFVDSLSTHDDYWKNGKGYLRIALGQVNNENIKSKYLVFPDLSEVKIADDSSFPLFFTRISGRIAIVDLGSEFYSKINNVISKRSKKKFLKLLEPFLFEKTSVVLKDMNGDIIGKDKGFRKQYVNYTESSGIEIIFYKNGSIRVKKTDYQSK